MKTAYFDAFSGLAGDMIVGALLDAGADFNALERALGSLGVGGYALRTSRVTRSGISAIKFEVDVSEHQPERHFGEIRAMIERADALNPRAKRDAIAVFSVLADAEAKVHHTIPDHVHFHEVGAVDSIVDIVGAAWALDALDISRIAVSPLPVGAGFVRSQHGTIPVPAPATAELLEGFPVRIGDGNHEMVTPTGAAILKALGYPAPMPLGFVAERVGYGAGSRELADRPNVLRIIVGREHNAYDSDELLEIETNIDDLSPQIYDHLVERLLAAGARDVTITPTIMKKGRPGVMLSILAQPANRDAIAETLFAETSTIGLRFHPVARLKLARETIEVATRFGPIRVKLSRPGGAAPITLSPEYEDCKRAALQHRSALRVVMDEARAVAQASLVK